MAPSAGVTERETEMYKCMIELRTVVKDLDDLTNRLMVRLECVLRSTAPQTKGPSPTPTTIFAPLPLEIMAQANEIRVVLERIQGGLERLEL
jgi:hypothetical protein